MSLESSDELDVAVNEHLAGVGLQYIMSLWYDSLARGDIFPEKFPPGHGVWNPDLGLIT